MISIIIPSRLAAAPGSSESFFLERAIATIRAQTLRDTMPIQLLVGIDKGAAVPAFLAGCGADFGLRFIESSGRSQAAALNAAARHARGDYLAFLEDDDEWDPRFLAFAHAALNEAAFVSSTQLEVTPQGDPIQINDFPTPSGWMMRRSTWKDVGQFNQSFRWHLDAEWIGRLAQKKVRRVHFVETAAPSMDDPKIKLRPHLARQWQDPFVRVLRQTEAPLIRRMRHGGSGIARIISDPVACARSVEERADLRRRFGALPV